MFQAPNLRFGRVEPIAQEVPIACGNVAQISVYRAIAPHKGVAIIRAYRFHPYPLTLFSIVCLCLAPVIGTGCNDGSVPHPDSPTTRPLFIQGRVYGGQQPVTGASIQLYAAGAPTSGGAFGAGATPLITTTVTTDHNGAFSITGRYTLPSAPSYFYIVSTGGSPGFGNPANPDIVMMAAIGGCTGASTLASDLFININEVTTAATILEFASGLRATQSLLAHQQPTTTICGLCSRTSAAWPIFRTGMYLPPRGARARLFIRWRTSWPIV